MTKKEIHKYFYEILENYNITQEEKKELKRLINLLEKEINNER